MSLDFKENIDAVSGQNIRISFPHHELHEGHAYTIEAQAAGGSGTKATLSFKTPDSEKVMHLLIHARANVEAHYTFGEAPTITADTGTNSPPFNRNRNSANTSDVIGTRTATAGQITKGATVSNFGTILKNVHFGNGKVGGERREDDEWLLKKNTLYAFEIESEAASSDINIEMEWYEHIPGE